MPLGELDTDPVPVPDFVTVRVKIITAAWFTVKTAPGAGPTLIYPVRAPAQLKSTE
jgi:hypothetical protein